MLGDLTGKSALVTGAGSGIGTGIATVMAAQGASVAVGDLNDEWADKVAEGIGGTAIAIQLNVTDVASVESAVQRVVSEWGRLDILVNNAGVGGAPGYTLDVDREEDWEATYSINVKGVVNCCNAAKALMTERRHGKVISIASMGGHSARKIGGAYAASKAAVLRYTKGLANELAPFNINVNAICPGAVWTRFQESSALAKREADPSLAGRDPEQIFLDRYEEVVPLGRPQTPEDVGKMAAFLASEDARNVTGQCVHVDGGVVIRD